MNLIADGKLVAIDSSLHKRAYRIPLSSFFHKSGHGKKVNPLLSSRFSSIPSFNGAKISFINLYKSIGAF